MQLRKVLAVRESLSSSLVDVVPFEALQILGLSGRLCTSSVPEAPPPRPVCLQLKVAREIRIGPKPIRTSLMENLNKVVALFMDLGQQAAPSTLSRRSDKGPLPGRILGAK
jgi:hypothetical protein